MAVLVVKMRNLVARKPCTVMVAAMMVMMMTYLLNRSLYDGGVGDEYDIYSTMAVLGMNMTYTLRWRCWG